MMKTKTNQKLPLKTSKPRTKIPWLGISVGLLGISAVAVLGRSLIAEETIKEKSQTKVEETTKDLKKGGRRLKRELRDATGQESVAEDLKDEGRNAKDEITHSAKKLKRKVD